MPISSLHTTPRTSAILSPGRPKSTNEFTLEKLYAYLVVDDIEADDGLINQARRNDGVSLNKIADIYYKRKEFRKAREWYQLAVIHNIPFAHYRLGVMYQNGKGAPVDYKQAMMWYLSAHTKGSASATNNIGTLYGKGKGVEKKSSVRFSLVFRGTRQGSSGAHYNLGVAYENGLGVEKDLLYALEMYERSSGQGHQKASNRIGRLNREGIYIGENQMRRKY